MPPSPLQQHRAELKKQLRALLRTRPYDPDKFPPLPAPDAESPHITTCEYSEFLRIEPLRTDILREWKRRSARESRHGHKDETADLLDDARRLSALLGRAAAASLRKRLTDALRDHYRGNKSEPSAEDEILLTGPDDRALHERILSDSLVRLHVRQDRHALWHVSPDNPHRLDDLSPDEWRRRFEFMAQQRAAWLVDVHLPARRKTAGKQAEWLLAQLRAIFGRPFDPSILPPLPESDAATAQAACEYSVILRIEPLRTDILREWKRRADPKCPDAEELRGRLNALLRQAAVYFVDTRFFDVVQLCKSGLRAERDAERREQARKLCGAEEIKVRALWNTTWGRRHIAAGECFRLPSLALLTTAHEWAISARRDCEANRDAQKQPRWVNIPPGSLQKQPLYEPADKSPASRRARTCWRILEALGDARLGRRHRNEKARLSLNEIVEKITGRKDGPRYRQISEMVELLRQCGFVRVDLRPVGNGKTAKHIAILKYPPRLY